MDRLRIVRSSRGKPSERAWSSVALVLVLLVSACTGSSMDEDGHGGTDLERDATVDVPSEPDATAGDAREHIGKGAAVQ